MKVIVMRPILVLIVLSLPISADAQHRSRGQRSSSPPRTTATAPRPDPSVLLPAGFKRLRPPSDRSRSSWQRGRQHGEMPPWWFHPGSRRPYFGGSYYALPYSGYYPAEDARYSPPPPEAEPAAMRTTGVLRLEITPATGLQYYIDGMFFGSSSELGTQFDVNAGARRIEIRAPGYKPVIFDARFVPGGTVTRRGALEPLEDVATLPRATGSRTMYVIPGCFMGNTRPEPSALPKGCDIGRMVTRGGL